MAITTVVFPFEMGQKVTLVDSDDNPIGRPGTVRGLHKDYDNVLYIMFRYVDDAGVVWEDWQRCEDAKAI